MKSSLVLIINNLLLEFLSQSFSNFKSFRINLLPPVSPQRRPGSPGTLRSRSKLAGFRLSQLLLSLGFLHGQQLVPLLLQVSRPLSQGLLGDLENISIKIFSPKIFVSPPVCWQEELLALLHRPLRDLENRERICQSVIVCTLYQVDTGRQVYGITTLLF